MLYLYNGHIPIVITHIRLLLIDRPKGIHTLIAIGTKLRYLADSSVFGHRLVKRDLTFGSSKSEGKKAEAAFR